MRVKVAGTAVSKVTSYMNALPTIQMSHEGSFVREASWMEVCSDSLVMQSGVNVSFL